MGFMFRGDPSTSPYPRFGASLARGFVTVCSQPAILVTAVILVFATWVGLTSLGLPPRAGYMGAALAISPISTSFDQQLPVVIFGQSPGLLIAPAFLIVRSLIVGGFAGMMVEAIEDGRVTMQGVRRGLRGFPPILGVEILGFGAVLVGQIAVFITGLQFIGIVLLLSAVLFFLGYAPAIAVADGGGLAAVVRRSIRAARVPGSQNIYLAVLCVVTSILLVPLGPGVQLVNASPGVGAWIWTILMNIVQLVFLAAYVYRYLYASPAIPDTPPPKRRR
jgi:hypothetical protein